MNPLAKAPPGRRLVIVEDEGILALDLQRHLQSAGFDVRGVAADSASAVALVEREHPDLVLMDITLPGAPDGIATAATLRERFAVPVVYLTAHGDPKTIERAQETEPMGYLLKPFKKPDLQNLVSIALARSQAERTLRRREELLSTTLSCIDEVIVTTDAAGAVTWLNDAAATLVGPLAEVSQHPLPEVLALTSDAGPMDELVSRACHEGRVQLQGTLRHDSMTHTMVGTAAALTTGQRSFGVVVALRDLTELLRTRRQLEFAERLASLGTLAAGVAHEVNNPLSVVMAGIEFALLTTHGGDARIALDEARDAARRVAAIVGDLRTFSSPQQAVSQPVDPREVIAAALRVTRAEWRKHVGVVLELRDTPGALASAPRLIQVLVNLVVNATHAMEGLARAHVLTVSSFTDGEGRPVIAVADTGPGIPAALRERIFEPFFTTKPVGKGTGLGLSVSRSIVEQLGGTLAIESSDAGTRFVVTLARAALPPSEPPRALWVGPASPAQQALGARQLDVSALRVGDRFPDQRLLLLALDGDDARWVTSTLAEFEGCTLHVSNGEPPPGALFLREPFDARALACFARRG